jgi:hypothetical protein
VRILRGEGVRLYLARYGGVRFLGATKRSMDISVSWRNREVRWMLITGVATQVLMWVIQAVKDH